MDIDYFKSVYNFQCKTLEHRDDPSHNTFFCNICCVLSYSVLKATSSDRVSLVIQNNQNKYLQKISSHRKILENQNSPIASSTQASWKPFPYFPKFSQLYFYLVFPHFPTFLVSSHLSNLWIYFLISPLNSIYSYSWKYLQNNFQKIWSSFSNLFCFSLLIDHTDPDTIKMKKREKNTPPFYSLPALFLDTKTRGWYSIKLANKKNQLTGHDFFLSWRIICKPFIACLKAWAPQYSTK